VKHTVIPVDCRRDSDEADAFVACSYGGDKVSQRDIQRLVRVDCVTWTWWQHQLQSDAMSNCRMHQPLREACACTDTQNPVVGALVLQYADGEAACALQLSFEQVVKKTLDTAEKQVEEA